MTELTILKGKDSQEAAQVLAAVTRSLLPQPGIAEISSLPALDSNVIESVLKEIRQLLRVPEGDFSRDTQSKIYAFLSSEISRVVFSSTSEKSAKDRLGNKGQLRPDQYQVVISENTTKAIEDLGNRKSHVIDAITHPDEIVHLQASHADAAEDIRSTISVKSVAAKRTDDEFTMLVITRREGQTQDVGAAFRVYPSEVDLRESKHPLHVLKAFVETYGLSFQLGDVISKYLENEVISVSPSVREDLMLSRKGPIPIEGIRGTYYQSFFAGAETRVQAPHSEVTVRVLFAFVIDISKYAATMRRHRVQLTPEELWKFDVI